MSVINFIYFKASALDSLGLNELITLPYKKTKEGKPNPDNEAQTESQ